MMVVQTKLTDRALEIIRSGTVEITHEAELGALLQENRPLTVKCGFDPTAPDMHLGHAVLLLKLRQFQDLGHKVVFLVGDLTATIGDPTGRNAQRPPISRVKIAENAASFKKQCFTILDSTKTEIVYNSELWSPSIEDLLKLMATTTVSQMLERDDFKKRFDAEQPIHLHELMYPLLQAMDSVKLTADVELGGTDQKLNLLMGRTLQRHFGKKPQVCVTMPIINGLDGVNKMSKSLGNHVGLTEAPSSQFAKLMSVSDEMMVQFRQALSLPDPTEEHPKEQKKEMAHAIVEMLHGCIEADRAFVDWELQFELKQEPEMETVTVPRDRLDRVIVSAGLAASNSDANRMIKSGAVSVNGAKAVDNKFELPECFVLKLGRNWKRVRF
jgi:tyrosyl-tRNA synthetase